MFWVEIFFPGMLGACVRRLIGSFKRALKIFSTENWFSAKNKKTFLCKNFIFLEDELDE